MATRVKIRALRTSLGLTAEEFAKKVGVNRSTIIRWEKQKDGTTPSPMARHRLRALAHPEGAPTSRTRDDETASAASPTLGIVPSRRLSTAS